MNSLNTPPNEPSILPWRRMGYPVVGDHVANNSSVLGQVIEVNETHCLIKWPYGQIGFSMFGLIKASDNVWGISHQAASRYLRSKRSKLVLSKAKF